MPVDCRFVDQVSVRFRPVMSKHHEPCGLLRRLGACFGWLHSFSAPGFFSGSLMAAPLPIVYRDRNDKELDWLTSTLPVRESLPQVAVIGPRVAIFPYKQFAVKYFEYHTPINKTAVIRGFEFPASESSIPYRMGVPYSGLSFRFPSHPVSVRHVWELLQDDDSEFCPLKCGNRSGYAERDVRSLERREFRRTFARFETRFAALSAANHGESRKCEEIDRTENRRRQGQQPKKCDPSRAIGQSFVTARSRGRSCRAFLAVRLCLPPGRCRGRQCDPRIDDLLLEIQAAVRAIRQPECACQIDGQ